MPVGRDWIRRNVPAKPRYSPNRVTRLLAPNKD